MTATSLFILHQCYYTVYIYHPWCNPIHTPPHWLTRENNYIISVWDEHHWISHILDISIIY